MITKKNRILEIPQAYLSLTSKSLSYFLNEPFHKILMGVHKIIDSPFLKEHHNCMVVKFKIFTQNLKCIFKTKYTVKHLDICVIVFLLL